MGGHSATLAKLATALRESWDSEIEAEILARRLLAEGPKGIEELAAILRESSGRRPKLAVGILNALRGSVNPYAKQLLSKLLDDDALAEEDAAYLLSIFGAGQPSDSEHGRRLLRKLKKTNDPTSRDEILREIVKLQVVDARELLAELSGKIEARELDYALKPEEAAQKERIRFALWALDGRQHELENIVFGNSHPYRRVAALEFLCLSLGTRSAQILRRVFQDPDPNLRGVALGLVGELLLVELADLVEAGLNDSNAWVVQQAAYALRDLVSSPEFSTDLDRVRALHRALLESLDKRSRSADRTDQQIIVPVLRKVASMLGRLLAT